MIALIDRLAAYAAREAENEDPEETKRQEEAAARRLAERVRLQKQRIKSWNAENGPTSPTHSSAGDDWGISSSTNGMDFTPDTPTTETAVNGKGKEKDDPSAPVKKFRGIPENVKLFEVFWHQVVELIKVRLTLSLLDVNLIIANLGTT